jgi:CelD/BcsL family acetyltransferase involved in cellulose biosynthesis
MDAESELTTMLATSLRQVGYVVKTYRGYTNCYQPGTDSFRSYRAKLPRSSRAQINKHLSKYRRLQQSKPTRLELFSDSTNVDRAIADFATVFQASWKQPDVHPQYIPRLIATGLAAKTLRLLVLYIEDQPAAVELAIIAEGRGMFYRTAYDPRFAEHSPGAIVRTKLVEHLIDRENVTEIDFGRDAEEHKKFWVRQQRVRQGIIAYNCSTFGGMFGLCWHTYERCWSMVKRKERE